MGKLTYIFPKTAAKIKEDNWYERAVWTVWFLHIWEASDFAVISITST